MDYDKLYLTQRCLFVCRSGSTKLSEYGLGSRTKNHQIFQKVKNTFNFQAFLFLFLRGKKLLVKLLIFLYFIPLNLNPHSEYGSTDPN